MQPTQNNTSTVSEGPAPLPRLFTGRPSVQSVRDACAPRHGWPRVSRLCNVCCAVGGMFDSVITR